MLDNIAKTSYRAYALSQGQEDCPHISSNDIAIMGTDNGSSKSISNCQLEITQRNSNNTPTTTPVRPSKRSLVIPNAPRISRKRTMTAPQLSAARRNIFIFLVNEE